MRVARTHFGNTYEEAQRSFIIPILFFPLTLALVYAYPGPALHDHSANAIALLYSLRMVTSWALFLGSVYFIARECGRKQYFWQFVIATNWLTVPASLVFLPVAWALLTGSHSWQEMYPFMLCITIYSYAFTAFMASWVLRIPWELAWFITIIGFIINDYMNDVLDVVGSAL